MRLVEEMLQALTAIPPSLVRIGLAVGSAVFGSRVSARCADTKLYRDVSADDSLDFLVERPADRLLQSQLVLLGGSGKAPQARGRSP